MKLLFSTHFNGPFTHAFLLRNIIILVFCFLVFNTTIEAQSLRSLLNKQDQWYQSEEAKNVADNILLFQRNTGGWCKGNDYFQNYSVETKQRISNDKRKKDSTFDNDATYSELEFMVKMYHFTKDERYKNAFDRGLDLIFDAQYENGGWPQYYPEFNKKWSWDTSGWIPQGLERFITFNDDVMTGILWLLKNVVSAENEYIFVDQGRKRMAGTAVEKGIGCILKSQFYYDGKFTAWPAQVDEVTFEPKWGRTYEPPSIAARESVEIIRFLMDIENPDKRTINAIHSAVKWLDGTKILDIRIIRGDTMSVEVEGRGVVHSGRRDAYVKRDKKAPPIWARYYELNTFRPVFGDRDEFIRYNLSDVSLERRSGYDWYGYWPEKLLSTEYPDWCRKHSQKNRLTKNLNP